MEVKFPELVQPFVDYLRFEKRYSVHTVSAYHDDLAQFLQYASEQYGGLAIKDISPVYVRSWLASLKENDISSRSINRKLSTLKSFFKYQVRIGILEQTPMANVIAPKAGKRLPVFVPED